MSNVFDPFGYTPSELAVIALIMLVAGVIGSIIVGVFVDKTGWYKRTMIILGVLVLSTGILVLIGISYIPRQKGVMIGLFALLGLFAIGYVPLSFSYGAELTFPLQPALVNGTLALLGSFTAFLISLLGAYLVKEGEDDDLLSPDELIVVRRRRSKYVVSILIVTTTMAVVLAFVIKEDLRRLNYKKETKETE